MTFSYVSASHTNTEPEPVPAAIHLPSLGTARHRTSSASESSVAISFPSSTRHTRILFPPLKRYSLFAENVTEGTQPPTSISIAGNNHNQHQRALHLVSTHRSLLTTWPPATQCSSAIMGVSGQACGLCIHFVHVGFPYCCFGKECPRHQTSV